MFIYKLAYDSAKREYCTSACWIHYTKRLFYLIKLCLNELCNGICIIKCSSDAYPIQNVLKQGNAFLPLLFNFDLEYAKISMGIRIEWNLSASDQYWTCYYTEQEQECNNKKHRSSIKLLFLKWTQKNPFLLFSLSDCRTRL